MIYYAKRKKGREASMALIVEKATEEQKKEFEKLREKRQEVGSSDWYFDEKTVCLLLEGKAVIDHYGERIPVEAGDLLTFPQGFRCQWIILEPIRVKGKL